MKTKKLNLNNLKVESFTTSIKKANTETVKGGVSVVNGYGGPSMCCSYLQGCIPSFNPDCVSTLVA